MTPRDERPHLRVVPDDGAPAAEPVPDRAAHVTDHLANERTFLAWIRTSIALISLGFVVAKFSVWLRQFQATLSFQHAADAGADSTAAVGALLPRVGISLPAGMALMAGGAALAVLALRRRRAVDRAIVRGEFRPDEDLAIIVTGGVVVASVAFISYLALTSTWG